MKTFKKLLHIAAFAYGALLLVTGSPVQGVALMLLAVC